METFILALDQGTSSTRSLLVDRQGNIVAMAQQELPQIYPQAAWVEHDAHLIWQHQLSTIKAVIEQAKISVKQISAIGITNQRETTVVWNKKTGQAISNAIVWQDRRTQAYCQELKEAGHIAMVQDKTGLLLDPYFSGTKLRWLLQNVPGAKALAQAGELAFGTIDAWLIWNLSQGQHHVTDTSNASRSLLWNLKQACWDSELLDLFEIPNSVLPQVLPSNSFFGKTHMDVLGHAIPIMGVAGDQQAALFGQNCWQAGTAKNTYGTGCFLLMHTGSQIVRSQHQLLSTAAASHNSQLQYALEGSVFMAGATIQWLRDGLGIIESSHQVEALATSVPNNGGVHLVPAFTGLGAPYWDANAKAAIMGLSRGSHKAHIARAALESIALQTTALVNAMNQDAVQSGGQVLSQLKVDGGASANSFLMQFQADLLGVPVLRPKITESTAMGAAYLAGLGAGIWQNTQELQQYWQLDRCFEPVMSRDQAQQALHDWDKAVQQVRCHSLL